MEGRRKECRMIRKGLDALSADDLRLVELAQKTEAEEANGQASASVHR